jgi:hypothetical protein
MRRCALEPIRKGAVASAGVISLEALSRESPVLKPFVVT